MFDLDGVDGVIESVPPDAPADAQALVGRFTGISFAVGDIAQAHDRLRAAGVPFTGEPEPQSWGGIIATLADPDGTPLQRVQYPSPMSAQAR